MKLIEKIWNFIVKKTSGCVKREDPRYWLKRIKFRRE